MSSFEVLGRTLIVLGGLFLLLGIVLMVAGRLPFFGRLPGDLVIRRDGLTIFFPLVTMIVVSIVGTIILNLVVRLFNR